MAGRCKRRACHMIAVNRAEPILAMPEAVDESTLID